MAFQRHWVAFWSGVAVGLLGGTLWLVGDIHAAVVSDVWIGTLWTRRGLQAAGVGALALGPLWYWFGRPLLRWWEARETDE